LRVKILAPRRDVKIFTPENPAERQRSELGQKSSHAAAWGENLCWHGSCKGTIIATLKNFPHARWSQNYNIWFDNLLF
jgi:hypothetical protein